MAGHWSTRWKYALRDPYIGEKTTLYVLSLHDIATFTLDIPYIVIAINSPGREESLVPDSPHRKALLRLQFHDTATERQGKIPFTTDQARQILEFIDQHAEVRTIVVQCAKGWNRSSAVAAALSHLMNGEDAYFWKAFEPRRHIWRRIIDEAERRKSLETISGMAEGQR